MPRRARPAIIALRALAACAGIGVVLASAYAVQATQNGGAATISVELIMVRQAEAS